jgi:translation initiation factor 2 subunit 3
VITFPKKAKPEKKAAKEKKAEKKAVKGSERVVKKPLPEVNIGLVGHVDHGKTSLTQALTGKWTDTHSEELKRGITIRLGYADATFYKCPKCKDSNSYSTTEKCIKCFSDCKPERTVSFVDAPGHETLMATVLSGTALMDGALLVISASEKCPQPQTREHLTALNIVGIDKIVVVQNKIDLVTEEEAMKNYREIREFLKGSVAKDAPIIPVSALQNINIDALIGAIEKTIPTPKRDVKRPPRMLIARSFDINRPGTPIKKLRGGVLGGSLIEGMLRVGDEVEIRPGIKIGERFEPVKTKITGLQKSMTDIEEAEPGGLLGVSTKLDPYLAKSDTLSGNVMGFPDRMPETLSRFTISLNLLERIVGSKEELKVEPVKTGDVLMITYGTTRTIATVTSARERNIEVDLKIPICALENSRIAISRQVSGRWRLIGWGEVK